MIGQLLFDKNLNVKTADFASVVVPTSLKWTLEELVQFSQFRHFVCLGLISVLAQLSSPKWEYKREKVWGWALEFGIKDPWGGWIGENRASGEYIDPKLNTPLNLSLSSYGSSQILTVIAQLFWSESGDIILIEEPEISLHPRGQASHNYYP